ncbi:MAG: hypothetical protein IPH76_18005 [Xanthomonadales bacterium]|nr:hypothetical protein [Xanthomonadales bacterium]
MLLLLILALFGLLRQRKIRRRPLAQTPLDPQLAAQRAPWHRTRAKPPWVGDELVRMKAFGKNLGYKKLADAFNRRFVDALGLSVAPSTVRRILIKRRADVIALRREVRNRVPRVVARNSTWGLDLTTVTDMTKRQRLVLGLVDHGTRACISLTELADKRSLTILREIVALKFRSWRRKALISLMPNRQKCDYKALAWGGGGRLSALNRSVCSGLIRLMPLTGL